MVLKSRQEMKLEARYLINQNRSTAVLAYLIILLLTGGVSALTVSLGFYFLVPIFIIALKGFFTRFYLSTPLTVSNLFDGIFDNYLRKLGAFWLQTLYVFLWSLLFFVPGVIKAYAYLMTPYILSAHPNVSAPNALLLSDRITRGYKADLFITSFSFILWDMLSVCTFGILEILHVGPYRETTFAAIYVQLEKQALENGTITQDMLNGDNVY